MAGEVVHDLDLAADVFDVVTVDELASGDGLASELLFGLFVCDQVGNAELAAAEDVDGPDVLHGPAEHTPDGMGSGGGRRGG